MAEYIEREAACHLMSDDYYGWRDKQLLKSVPAADVAPVRHGRWVKNNDGIMIWWECSECHHDAWYDGDNLYNFCPNCGAKMDGGTDGKSN